MQNVTSWAVAVKNSFIDVWNQFIGFIPEIIAALVVFIIGLYIAKGLGRLIEKILEKINLDRRLDEVHVKDGLEKIGFKTSVSRFFGLLVYWLLVAVFLIIAAEILDLPTISAFIKDVVYYIPNVIVAVAILSIGLIAAGFVQTAVFNAATAAGILAAAILGALARWSIIIFAIMAALIHLRIAPGLIQTFFTGFVGMLALAGGLAFGLGGKDRAKLFIEQITDRYIKK
ncbi:hypothetical protein C4569_03995 [Candidatus Parcubacteria bacterium]|nr:MAG: hypothetical protein C4569_03995 [Candidatus Parcubacteria bacterium]